MSGAAATGTRWIIDANNVIGSRPDGWWRDRPAAQRRLIDEVATWAAATRADVTVVLDGSGRSGTAGSDPTVEVVYAGSSRPNAADDEIVSIVAAESRSICRVVTSDRELARRVGELGAEVHGAGRFRDLLES